MYRKAIATLLILLAFSVNASEKKLTVAFGTTLAPWVIADSHEGILIDIISEAMEPLGYQIEPHYFPYARRIISYQNKNVEVVIDINENNITNSNLSGYFSGNFYAYENFAFSLKKRQFDFKKISDLTPYSLMSWQGARKQLGDAYDQMAENSSYYIETDDQTHQVEMLFAERVDIIQMDKHIFEYYRNNLIKDGKISADIEVDHFALFGKNPNGAIFRTRTVRDDFLKQLALMKTDGRFQQIFDKYMTAK